MINIIKENFKRALFALIFSIIAIGTLSFLSFETPYGLFLAGSFGSSMVLLFGYPESPFAQPKNVFFGHFITSLVGVIVFQFVPLDQYIQIALSVALGIFLMIIFFAESNLPSTILFFVSPVHLCRGWLLNFLLKDSLKKKFSNHFYKEFLKEKIQ